MLWIHGAIVQNVATTDCIVHSLYVTICRVFVLQFCVDCDYFLSCFPYVRVSWDLVCPVISLHHFVRHYLVGLIPCFFLSKVRFRCRNKTFQVTTHLLAFHNLLSIAKHCLALLSPISLHLGRIGESPIKLDQRRECKRHFWYWSGIVTIV